MSYYSVFIPRCTHIKTNGTQCGSPALRGRRFCFFHKNWRGERIQLHPQPASTAEQSFTLPVLEDADSVQVALMQVMRLILSGQLEPKTAGLLLYALQTASLNLRRTDLEPVRRERIVIDPGAVSETPLGQDPWAAADFEEDEEEEEDDSEQQEEDDTGEEENDEEEDGGEGDSETTDDENEEELEEADAEPEDNYVQRKRSAARPRDPEQVDLDELRDSFRKMAADAVQRIAGENPRPALLLQSSDGGRKSTAG